MQEWKESFVLCMNQSPNTSRSSQGRSQEPQYLSISPDLKGSLCLPEAELSLPTAGALPRCKEHKVVNGSERNTAAHRHGGLNQHAPSAALASLCTTDVPYAQAAPSSDTSCKHEATLEK